MMRKMKLFTCICAVALLLAACTPSDPDNLFETTAAPSEGASQPSESTVVSSQPTEGDMIAEPSYAYGNMQKNIPSGNYMQDESAVLFIGSDGKHNLLKCYDLKTGEVRLFCRDATCEHSDETCPSRAIESNLESYRGTIYGLSPKGIVMKWNGKAWTEMTEPGAASFWHAEDRLYVVTKDSSLLCYEPDSKKPVTISEEFPGFWNTVFGNYLYFSSFSYNVSRLDLSHPENGSQILMKDALFVTDGAHLYYTPLDTGYLWRCDMDGTNPVQLTEKQVVPASWNLDADYFYFRMMENQDIYAGTEAHQLYRFPKQDPGAIEKIAELDETIYQVFAVPDAKQIVVTTTAEDTQDTPVYIMDQDGGNLRMIKDAGAE